jgi:hypothetical protein
VDLLGPRGEILSAARDSYVPRGLGGALTVDVGRVDEIDAALERRVGARAGLLELDTAGERQPRAEGDLRDLRSEDPSLR